MRTTLSVYAKRLGIRCESVNRPMTRVTLPRILLAAGAGLLFVVFALAMIRMPPVAIAGDDLTSQPPTSNFQLPITNHQSLITNHQSLISNTKTLCFVSDGVACVDRIGIQSTGALTDRVRSLMQTMVAGPTASERALGVRSALPAGAALVDVSVTPDRAVIRFDLPAAFLSTFDASDAEDVNEQVATTLTPFNFSRIDVEVRDPLSSLSSGVFRPLSSFLPAIPIPTKPGEANPHTPIPPYSTQGGQPPEYGHPQSKGGLSGKTVFVSAGHGWYWHAGLGQHRTQRPVYPSAPYPAGEGIIEDFNNAEVVNQYLLQYLWNAGADAWTVRERDMNLSMTIVDDVSPDFSLEGSWLITTAPGGYTGAPVYSGTYIYSGTYFYTTTVTSGATATATWSFTPTADAEYAVFVWFPNASNRTPAARYSVEHAGGTTVLTITQQRDGINWRTIGTYPFRAGSAGQVRLTNQSTVPGQTVLADAIRVGGGIGDVAPPDIPPSFRPRWEEQALRYALWVGVPDVETLSDVIVRPLFSEWEYESGEDAIYISWHTNGYNGYNTEFRGTETYIHSFEPTTNSSMLQNYIHAELLGDIHAGWEAAWPDRGQKSRDLGELRLLETMPGILIENGYHDSLQDVEAQKEPSFNLLSARAVYQGIVRYWNAQDPNVPQVFLPEPPTHLRVRNTGPNQVTLAWRPGPIDSLGLLGHAATSYRVYTSADGFGWSDAIPTSNTALTLTGLVPGQLIYVRVAGVNAGGESFPTPVLAARAAWNNVAPVLIVYGFDRIDRRGLIQQTDPPEGSSRRMFLDRINRYDYVVQHAPGITYAFDSAVHAAVTDGDIGMGNYVVVDWIAGEEQSPDMALNATDQSLIQSFLDAGGALLISGAEIGFDLVGNGVGPSFYGSALRSSFVGDDAGTYAVTPAAGGIFDSLGPFSFDDGTHRTYDVDRPDRFAPLGGATSALLYNGGLGGAALAYTGAACARLIYVGFPLETIYPQSTRDALLSRSMAFLDDCIPSTGPDTAIASPVDGAAYNTLPAFNGTAGGPNGVGAVQVAILSGTQYHSGTTFVPIETWLTATGTVTWSYGLPLLPDGDYMLRARAIESGGISDSTPAAVTFTLDTISPTVPTPITPTGGISVTASMPTFAWTGSGDSDGFDFDLNGAIETLSNAVLSVTRSVAQGLHTWRVRAFDRAGNYSDWSAPATFRSPGPVYLPLVAKDFTPESTPPPTCYEAIANGGFEMGFTGWLTPSFTPPLAIVSSPVFSGVSSVRVGSDTTTATVNGFSSVQQSVTIPVTATTALLQFQRYQISGDTLNDLQYIAVFSGTTVLDNLVYERVDHPTWVAAQFDLLEYAGQAINIRFSVKNDGTGGATGMVVDAVSLQICGP